MDLTTASQEQLSALQTELEQQFEVQKQAGLKLDLTRGKPSSDQLALSESLDGILAGDYTLILIKDFIIPIVS